MFRLISFWKRMGFGELMSSIHNHVPRGKYQNTWSLREPIIKVVFTLRDGVSKARYLYRTVIYLKYKASKAEWCYSR